MGGQAQRARGETRHAVRHRFQPQSGAAGELTLPDTAAGPVHRAPLRPRHQHRRAAGQGDETSWTSTCPHSTNGGTRAVATVPSSTRRSSPWASREASRLSAATSARSRPPPPGHPRRPAPRPRRIVRWIMTDPGNLTLDDAADLMRPGPLPRTRRRHLPRPRLRRHDARPAGRPTARLDGPRPRRRPARPALPRQRTEPRHQRRHRQALHPWSSRQVEGQATRTKRLKRQGYGRVNLDFLRKRILLTP
jgi:hypothetical protein